MNSIPDIDGLAAATPLAVAKDPSLLHSVPGSGSDLMQLFVGYHPSSMGEASVAALLVGGAVLLVFRIIDWRVPFFYIATTVFMLAVLPYGSTVDRPPEVVAMMPDAIYLALSGGLFLGAIFMATDMVTSPITRKGADHLRDRMRRHHRADPALRRIPGGRMLRDPDHEHGRTPDRPLLPAESLRRGEKEAGKAGRKSGVIGV